MDIQKQIKAWQKIFDSSLKEFEEEIENVYGEVSIQRNVDNMNLAQKWLFQLVSQERMLAEENSKKQKV